MFRNVRNSVVGSLLARLGGLFVLVLVLVLVLLVVVAAGGRFPTDAEPTQGVKITNDRTDIHKAQTPPMILQVGVPRTSEHLWIDGPAKLYEPAGLEPLRTYELRVSFVSTRSAQVHLGLIGAKPATAMRRQLLHAEKLVFSTDESGRVRGAGEGCRLEVSVTSWGRMREGVDGDFFYDVVLERNVLGVPISGMPLMVYALLVVCVLVASGCLVRGEVFLSFPAIRLLWSTRSTKSTQGRRG